jgi:hypothetical protein
MYSLSVNENLCRWRCLVPDACSESQQFLAFRGSLPAKREVSQVFHRISSDPSRLWAPLRLVGPFETLGTTTSRRTLRDSGNHYVSSDPSRLWKPQRLVRPFETLRTVHRTDQEGFWVMFLSIEKAPATGSGALSCAILLWSSDCSRNLLRFFRMLRPHHIDLRVRGHRHS